MLEEVIELLRKLETFICTVFAVNKLKTRYTLFGTKICPVTGQLAVIKVADWSTSRLVNLPKCLI